MLCTNGRYRNVEPWTSCGISYTVCVYYRCSLAVVLVVLLVLGRICSTKFLRSFCLAYSTDRYTPMFLTIERQVKWRTVEIGIRDWNRSAWWSRRVDWDGYVEQQSQMTLVGSVTMQVNGSTDTGTKSIWWTVIGRTQTVYIWFERMHTVHTGQFVSHQIWPTNQIDIKILLDLMLTPKMWQPTRWANCCSFSMSLVISANCQPMFFLCQLTDFSPADLYWKSGVTGQFCLKMAIKHNIAWLCFGLLRVLARNS